MDHDKIKMLLDMTADGEATSEERKLAEKHLLSCAECQEERVITTRFSKALKRDLQPLDANFSIEVMSRILPEKNFSWGQLFRSLIPIPILASAFMIFNTIRSNEIPSTYSLLSEGLRQDSSFEALVYDENTASDYLVTSAEGDTL